MTHPAIRKALKENEASRRDREKKRQERNAQLVRDAQARGDLKPSA